MKTYAILIVLIVASITPVIAFELKPISAADDVFRIWDQTQGAVRITLNSNGSEDLSSNDVELELENAIRVWQKVTGSVLLEYAGMNSNAVPNSSDQINSVQWEEKQWDYSSSTLAITKYTYVIGDPAYMIDADILFNGKDWKWGKDQKVNDETIDFQQVLLHELGHLLGLSHSAVVKAALYPYLPEKVKHTLNSDDKKGVQYLYDSPIVDFVQVTPVKGAVYPGEILNMGLPLPVFRWYGGVNTTFTVEFSNALDFKKKISFSSASKTYLELSPTNVEKVLLLAPSGKVFWRVSSGSTSTNPRLLKFKNTI